jgi:hypothetical protein
MTAMAAAVQLADEVAGADEVLRGDLLGEDITEL